MDHFIVADIDADMAGPMRIIGPFKENQIAGPCVGRGDTGAYLQQPLGTPAANAPTGMIDHPADKAGAIKAGFGFAAAPDIGISQIFFCLGNRPDLFPHTDYPTASEPGSYEDYEIPPEALEDEVFAAMIAEAEKYLGFPYVWGGSKPETSFDCSGFVSWVVNHSGWSIGRRSAQGLLDVCTRVSPANARPGDLIFFERTYDTHGASHVGIYVGNNKMIHCGSPISYASINTPYWQDHFLAYGRLP